MDSVIGQINSLGKAFVDFMWPMLWQSSVLIAILLALDFMLRRKVVRWARAVDGGAEPAVGAAADGYPDAVLGQADSTGAVATQRNGGALRQRQV